MNNLLFLFHLLLMFQDIYLILTIIILTLLLNFWEKITLKKIKLKQFFIIIIILYDLAIIIILYDLVIFIRYLILILLFFTILHYRIIFLRIK